MRAWDGHCDDLKRKAAEETLEARMRAITTFGEGLRAKAVELLPTVHRATPSGIAALGKAAVDIELRGMGKPSEVLELRGRIIDEAIERELEKLARAKAEGLSSEPGPGEEED